MASNRARSNHNLLIRVGFFHLPPGAPASAVLSAFPALTSHHHDADTVLTGLLDQSALYGVLAEIEALGLDLVEVLQLTPDRKPPRSSDSRSP